MFIGRREQLRLLEDRYRSRTSEFCVLYGRRRIGKSTLLEEFAGDKLRLVHPTVWGVV
jgi:hypothetical protein